MIDCVIDKARRMVSVRLSWKSSYLDLVRCFDKLYQDPQFDSNFNILFHISVDSTFLRAHIHEDFRAFLKGLADRQKGPKWAIVSPSRTQLAMTQILVENMELGTIQVRFFDNDEGAMQWLNSAEDTPAK